MRTLVVLVPMLLLSLLACERSQPPVAAETNHAMLQCMKDIDCKGDRICESGKCTNPPTQAPHVIPATSVAPLAMQPAAPEEPALKRVFVAKNLQSNVEYFEKITGPARESYRTERIYDVDGCEVIGITTGKLVSAIGINIKKGCAFDLNAFLPNYEGKFPPISKLTMRKFQDIVGSGVEYYVPCFDCGTSMDPISYARWLGSHADNFMEVRLETQAVPESVKQAVQAEGPNFNFNCKPNKYESLARQDPPPGVIRSIVVGYDIPAEKCD